MVYDDEVEEIFIEPPHVSELTDEDSGEEEGGTFDNLSGRQLRALVEVKLSNSTRITSIDDENSPSKEALATSENVRRKIQLKENITWIDGDVIKSASRQFQEPSYHHLKDMSCIEIFEKFIDTDVITLLVDETQKYAAFRNRPDPKITPDDIRCFIAILIKVVMILNLLPNSFGTLERT